MKKNLLLIVVVMFAATFSFVEKNHAQSQGVRHANHWQKQSPYFKEGPFEVVTDSNYTISPNILIHRPSSDHGGPYPVMLFHQGAGVGIMPRTYDVFMKHLASYGYVVVVNAITFPPNPLKDDLKLTLDWIERQVVEDAEGWAGYADTSKIIVGGHSFGGVVATTFITNQPERAAGVIYFGSNAAPEQVQPLAPYQGKVLTVGGTEDTFVLPNDITETFERFTNASCRTKVLVEGMGHGAFGIYERDPVGSIGREKATETIRHFLISFMEASFKGDKVAALNLFNTYKHPVKLTEFDASCSPFNSTDPDKILRGVKLFPNPVVYNNIYLSVASVDNYSYELRDTMGEIRKSDSNLNGKTTIDVSGLSKGLYYIIVRADGKKRIARLFKI